MSVITGQTEQQHLLQNAATSTGNGVTLDVSKYSTVTIQTIGTFSSDTVTYEGTIDETTWVALQGTNLVDGTFGSTSTVADEFRTFNVAGLKSFRARISTYGSGSITVSARSTPVSGGGGGSPASVDLNEPIGVEGTVADGSTSTDNPVIQGAVDGSGNVQALLSDTSGQLQIVGAAADGAAEAGNPVLVAGSDGTNAETILIASTGRLITGASVTPADALGNTASRLITSVASASAPLQVFSMIHNGTTWDMERGNEDITLLASSARTVQTDSSDTTNFNGRGILITLDFSIEADTVTLTPSIVAVDPVTGTEEFEIWSAAAGVTAIGNTSYLLYPGVLAADFDGTEAVSIALPRTWFLRMKVGDGSSATYSVGGSVIL